MAELFKDGCDHYATGQASRKWDNESVANIAAGQGRFGGGALQVGIFINKNVDNKKTLRVKFSINRLSTDVAKTIVRFLDVTTEQVDLHWRANNSLELFAGGVSVATTAPIFSLATWYQMEMVVVIDGSTGSVEVRIDGSSTPVINTGSIDTQVSANDYTNIVEFRTEAVTRLDDVVIYDDATFSGDHRIVTLYPDGEGNYTQFATTFPASPTTHFTSVDETPMDDDTSYNEDDTIGNKDSFTLDDMPALVGGTTIESVSHHYVARKDDAGARSVRGFLRVGGTDYNGTENLLSTSYVVYSDNHVVDPDTAVAWIAAGVDGTESGVETR